MLILLISGVGNDFFPGASRRQGGSFDQNSKGAVFQNFSSRGYTPYALFPAPAYNTISSCYGLNGGRGGDD